MSKSISVNKIRNKINEHQNIKVSILILISLSILLYNFNIQYSLYASLSSLVLSIYLNQILTKDLKLKNE